VREWQATKAREALPEIIDGAVAGIPQIINRRDGKEVVVVSREYFDATRPNLKDYLLRAGYADERDAFDDALDQIRESGGGFFRPRPIEIED
jgi:hypothetical protein